MFTVSFFAKAPTILLSVPGSLRILRYPLKVTMAVAMALEEDPLEPEAESLAEFQSV